MSMKTCWVLFIDLDLDPDLDTAENQNMPTLVETWNLYEL
jgi:hypothetical protein